MSRLAGKVAFVTGGASGIGRAVCRRFVAEGASVVVADVNATGAAALADELGDKAISRRIDVRLESDWVDALDLAVATFGRLDLVCNIAGIGRGGSIEEIDMADWQAMVDVNLTGPVLGTKHGIKTIVRSGGSGAVINMSSMLGMSASADLAGYAAVKAGVLLLSKSAALHCAEKRYPVRCVSILPTYVDSEMLDPLAESADALNEVKQHMAALVPVGRIATVDDVANAVLFAASDEAAMITGSGIIVDGGQTSGLPSAHF
ncbi:SDR family NAD(P)-dependent oxidoreductase [Sphingobium chungbukense]|uniref:3-beta hydroxysteroid dehydrogenase n=1 Tax=Sphingobium chungbukense TaxID=56193 RepID=A0A0M3AJ63_9SPHN|nr:SDR family oxidoreductase [Sphingobium chungbukense]KKW90132.1 3-beta hydroxysteroid dehydrogenase [Sphingobium chungbukense]